MGSFVEYGAFNGVFESSCKFFEESLNWSGHNIESVPWIYEELAKNRACSRSYNLALSDTCGVQSFIYAHHRELGRMCINSSLQHDPVHLDRLRETGYLLKEISIQCMTWDGFCHHAGITSIDLLVLSFSGTEEAVFSGFSPKSIHPKIICIRHERSALQKITELMSNLNYKFDQTLFVDSCFIRNVLYCEMAVKNA